MKVDAELIVKLRNERCWSQEELATAAGLNLRTVQRIEREGAVSLQSKKALASVFEIDANALDYTEPQTRYEYKTVVVENDVSWKSVWNRKKAQNYKLDDVLNEFALQGWKVHSINFGSSVHGGAGQAMVLFERTI